MRYLSIDIETTGLDPTKHNILEVGAVLDDLSVIRPVESLPTFHCYVLPPDGDYIGDPFALHMNYEIIRNIALKADPFRYYKPYEVGVALAEFLCLNGYRGTHRTVDESVIAGGKNFSAFDRPFLMNLPGFKNHVKFKHRALDPAMYFLDKNDTEPPNMALCLSRAKIEIGERKQHNALEDATFVVELIRAGINRLRDE